MKLVDHALDLARFGDIPAAREVLNESYGYLVRANDELWRDRQRSRSDEIRRWIIMLAVGVAIGIGIGMLMSGHACGP